MAEEILRAFKFALDPTPAQAEALARHAGAARWAFNHALGMKVAAHQQWREQVQALVKDGVAEAEARKRVKVPIPTKPAIQKHLNLIKGDSRRGGDALPPIPPSSPYGVGSQLKPNCLIPTVTPRDPRPLSGVDPLRRNPSAAEGLWKTEAARIAPGGLVCFSVGCWSVAKLVGKPSSRTMRMENAQFPHTRQIAWFPTGSPFLRRLLVEVVAARPTEDSAVTVVAEANLVVDPAVFGDVHVVVDSGAGAVVVPCNTSQAVDV